ncbi:TPA: mercury transporter MerT [Legionella pneumophila]|nr:mercuric transporter MerT family protein [Legionella pneumophila]HAT8858126.1 mercury transporter MerT [Legionella pneumophila subsp. pneumophila]HAT7074300.1 mercury transporter MerT [Legionella pneumophila]HAT8643094.1 mercury transporter MerT [Legionella pneumophila]HAT8869576.1 mercury transporter MerT [Legionella pneumophila subsp. pneumophila]HAU0163558.1 mercury transporter MerT [Legionella pneumophila]
MTNSRWILSTLGGAIIGAFAASLCCIGPLALLALGIGGVWVSTLTQLEFLRPIGIAITLIFLILAFWRIYLVPRSCSEGKSCSKPGNLLVQRLIFWIIALLLILLLTFPQYAFLFY